MSKNRKLKKEILKEYILLNWLLSLIGVVLLFAGIYRFFFLEPSIGINARYLQPTVSNGGVMIIAGLAMVLSVIYRIRKKSRVLKDTLDLEKEKELK
ncbi:hypothetical protein [Snuella sedimenti]|uniref:hypothetical protein n=1 Tax=Snuella sedimenti TaxID=2798802 RepID=UPI0018EC2E27|nr:hypothetical protein [Snuella sedimenti]